VVNISNNILMISDLIKTFKAMITQSLFSSRMRTQPPVVQVEADVYAAIAAHCRQADQPKIIKNFISEMLREGMRQQGIIIPVADRERYDRHAVRPKRYPPKAKKADPKP
jgi:2-keto-3-deoxy-L-rhamnonate aldolase RhmA